MDLSNIQSFLPIILLVVVFYFLIIRPSMKRNKETKNFVDTMEIGDEVMTAGGFYGLVYAIDDENVVLEMLPDYNKLMIRKSSIVKFITAEAAEAERTAEEKANKKSRFGKKDDDVQEVKEVETIEAEKTEPEVIEAPQAEETVEEVKEEAQA